MKFLPLKKIFFLLLGFLMGYTEFHVNANVLLTLFTVLGIGFSIAISNILSFDLSEIANPIYRKPIVSKLKSIEKQHGIDFLFVTISYIVCLSVPEETRLGMLENHIDIYSILAFYIVNSMIDLRGGFVSIQKLGIDVSSKIIEERHLKRL